MKKLFFFLLLFITLLLGCNQTQTTNGVITPSLKSKGLNIINFTSTFDSVRIKESTVINLKLKNNGDFQVEMLSQYFMVMDCLRKQT